MKPPIPLLALLSGPGSQAALLPPAACAALACVPPGPPGAAAVHLVVSRASTEAPGPGILGTVANAVAAACPGSDVAANPYPAVLSPYLDSETDGVGNLTEMVTTYQTCCPGSKMVLMGYSQGAQVTADFLCGTSEAGFPASKAYAADVAAAVDAVVLMGDPSFVKGQSWNRGNASNVSFFPRQNNAACAPVAAKMVSYCDSGDYFCDNGTSPDALSIHRGYVREYGTDAVDWIIRQIGGCSS